MWEDIQDFFLFGYPKTIDITGFFKKFCIATRTKNLSENYCFQTFLLFDFSRFSLRNPPFPDQIRIPADKPLFGCNRMRTDKGGLMESRVWFRRPFSVRDVHWQKWAEKGGQDEKKGATQEVFVAWTKL